MQTIFSATHLIRQRINSICASSKNWKKNFFNENIKKFLYSFSDYLPRFCHQALVGLGEFFNSGLHKSEGCKECDWDFHTGCFKLRGSLLNIWMASIDPRMVPKLDFFEKYYF